MKTFLLDIFPKIKQYSLKLDEITLLTNQHWVVIDEIKNSKNVYIFRDKNELLISQNGKVEKGRWEYLGNKSLLIDKGDESYLFKHGFFDENILALKVDSSEEYAVFVNENKYEGELNSIEGIIKFLTSKYINNAPKVLDLIGISSEKTEKAYLTEKQKLVEFNKWEVADEKQSSVTDFWGNIIEERIKITFTTTDSGWIFIDNNGYYLWDKTGSKRVYYIDKKSTINSLFILNKSGEVSDVGFVKSKP